MSLINAGYGMGLRIRIAFDERPRGHHGRQQPGIDPVAVKGVFFLIREFRPPISCLEDASNEPLSVEVGKIKCINCEKLLKFESHERRDSRFEVFEHVSTVLKDVDGQHIRPGTTNNKSVEHHNEEENRSGPMPS